MRGHRPGRQVSTCIVKKSMGNERGGKKCRRKGHHSVESCLADVSNLFAHAGRKERAPVPNLYENIHNLLQQVSVDHVPLPLLLYQAQNTRPDVILDLRKERNKKKHFGVKRGGGTLGAMVRFRQREGEGEGEGEREMK